MVGEVWRPKQDVPSQLLSKIYIDQQNEERLTNNEMNENIYDTISFFNYNTLSNIAINYYLIIDILDDHVVVGFVITGLYTHPNIICVNL